MMVACLGGLPVEAVRGVEHRLDYRCPLCGEPVVLHARIDGWVIPHFQHKVGGSCSHGAGETPAHRAVKSLIRDHYRGKGHHVELEYRIELSRRVGHRRPDVFIEAIKAAFEVEFSSREVSELIEKCKDYAGENLKSIWILRQNNINLANIKVGNRLIISTSPVLRVLRSKKMRPRGASLAFFVYEGRQAKVFRGELSSLMFYRPLDEFSGAGAYEYESSRHALLLVREVIPAPDISPTAETS